MDRPLSRFADIIDLDAVDDDRDEDSDEATPERQCGVDRPRRADRAAVVRGAVAGAAAGAGAVAARTAIQRHPKAAVGAAVLGAVLVALPPDKRVQAIRAAGVVAAVLAGLAVLAVGVVLALGVAGPSGSITGGTTSIQDMTTAPAPYCQWGSLC
jgi:hypothetical protein